MSHQLRLHRRLAASPEEVYAAWTDAESLMQWMRPFEGCRTVAQMDAKVGGRYSIDMHGQNETYPHTGEYLRLEPGRLVEFTWISNGTHQQRSIVTVELAPAGSGETDLTLTHKLLPDAEAVTSHTGGWNAGLDHLVARMRALPASRAA